jgi:hypothetical protein
MLWERGGALKLKSDSASIRHMIGGRGGLGHEQLGFKVWRPEDTKVELESSNDLCVLL